MNFKIVIIISATDNARMVKVGLVKKLTTNLDTFYALSPVSHQSGRGQDVVQKEDRSLEDSEPVSRPCTPENKVIQNEVTLSSLQHCVQRLREGPPSLTSINFITGLNMFQG